MANKSKGKKTNTHEILNRRAGFDYNLDESIVVGMVLTGQEVRACRDNRVQLKGSFVTIRNNELWLNNANFTIKPNKPNLDSSVTDATPKKLLAKRKEIDYLYSKKQDNYTIVVRKMLIGGKFIKLVIAPGKGKKAYDKRETIKRRQQDREAKKFIKRY